MLIMTVIVELLQSNRCWFSMTVLITRNMLYDLSGGLVNVLDVLMTGVNIKSLSCQAWTITSRGNENGVGS